MKKTLLTAALAACAFASASAQVNDNFTGHIYSAMSDNGRYVAESVDGSISFLDRWTGAAWTYTANNANGGNGHCVSNTGILVGTNGTAPCYWLDGTCYELPLFENTSGELGGCNAITPDGKYIVGDLGTGVGFGTADGLMNCPAIWTRQDDGTYKVDTLAYPHLDFTGRAPQYVMFNDISADGSVIVCQVRDYTGFYNYPAIYKKGADGKWSFTVVGDGLIWDAEKIKAVPAEPVDPSDEVPVAESYFTAADTVAYNNAVDEYIKAAKDAEDGLIPWTQVPERPDYVKYKYITDNHDQWAADSAAYEAKRVKYLEDFDVYQQALRDATFGNSFQFNNLVLSANGKYLGTTFETSNPDADPEMGNVESHSYPTVIDLTGDKPEVNVYDNVVDATTTSVANDGQIIACSPVLDYARNSFVIKDAESDPVNFYDYIAARNEKAGIFLKENYSFDVPVYDDEGGDEPGWGDEGGLLAQKKALKFTAKDYSIVNDSIVTGTVFGNSDNTIFNSFMMEEFSNPEGMGTYRSYVIDLNENAQSGIKGVKKADEADAAVIGREYYNINGQRISAAPAKGIYLEKRITANGFTTVKHVK